MPPGTYAPSLGTASASLKKMKGTGTAAGIPAKTPIGAPMAAPASTVPRNPTAMSTAGGSTQQTDQMGRVITSTAGGVDLMGRPMAGAPASMTIEDPDLIRRSRDLADEQTRLATPGAAPRAGSPGPSPTPGIDPSEIPGLLDQFKPETVPREPGFTAPPRITGERPEDRRAAESAQFARAADRIAAVGRGNLAGLRNQMTRRGISGSDIEAENVRSVQNNTAGQLGEVIRDQAIESLDREQDINDRDYAGGISQRGQDIGVLGTNYSGGVSQRGQDLSQADWKLQALPSILALLRMKSGAA